MLFSCSSIHKACNASWVRQYSCLYYPKRERHSPVFKRMNMWISCVYSVHCVDNKKVIHIFYIKIPLFIGFDFLCSSFILFMYPSKVRRSFTTPSQGECSKRFRVCQTRCLAKTIGLIPLLNTVLPLKIKTKNYFIGERTPAKLLRSDAFKRRLDGNGGEAIGVSCRASAYGFKTLL